MTNARERRAKMRAKLHVPAPAPEVRWLSTKELRRGKVQEVNLASVRYVILNWVKGKGFCVHWNHKRISDGYQDKLSSCEYFSHVNAARLLFVERVRQQAIEFAINTLDLD